MSPSLLLLGLLNALAFLVDPSTEVAELFGTPAPHVVAALRLFHPMLAERALLELFPLRKLQEQLIVFVHRVGYLVLFAALALVEDHSAVEAIMLFARGALEFVVPVFKDKCELAVGCGTPRGVGGLLHGLVEGKIVVLLELILVQDILDVLNVQLCFAAHSRALEWESTVLDFISEVSLKALHVEVADTALKGEEFILLVEVFVTDLTDHIVCFLLFLLLPQLLQPSFVFLLHLLY